MQQLRSVQKATGITPITDQKIKCSLYIYVAVFHPSLQFKWNGFFSSAPFSAGNYKNREKKYLGKQLYVNETVLERYSLPFLLQNTLKTFFRKHLILPKIWQWREKQELNGGDGGGGRGRTGWYIIYVILTQWVRKLICDSPLRWRISWYYHTHTYTLKHILGNHHRIHIFSDIFQQVPFQSTSNKSMLYFSYISTSYIIMYIYVIYIDICIYISFVYFVYIYIHIYMYFICTIYTIYMYYIYYIYVLYIYIYIYIYVYVCVYFSKVYFFTSALSEIF